MGNLSPGWCRVFTQANSSVVCQPQETKKKRSQLLPQSEIEGKAVSVAGTLSLTLQRTRQSHQEQKKNLMPATGHRLCLGALPCPPYPAVLITTGVIKTFSLEHILGSCWNCCRGWMNVSVFGLPADHTQQETDETPGRMLALAGSREWKSSQ